MKLFQTGKTAVTLDTITHKLERRKGGEAKVIDLACRVQPFTAQLALSVDEVVKGALFKRTNGDPQSYVHAMEFLLPVERQQVHVFATPDTAKASILFDQAKVAGLRARVEKGVGGYAFTFRLIFGPVSKAELEFVEAWRTEMRFLSFEVAEPNLDLEPPSSGDDDDDDPDEAGPKQPEPMFDDPRDGDRANRKTISHANGKGKRR